MAQISWTGSFNPATLNVADVYLNVIPPGSTVVLPASSGVCGVVGVASWGPKNLPTPLSAASTLMFGPGPVVRSNDLLTAAAVVLPLQQQAGIGGMMGVRVTDGTDLAALVIVGGAAGLTVTSKYTGTFGNQCSVVLSAGSYSNSFKLVIQMPGLAPETFDNMAQNLTGNAIFIAMANAINNGVSGVRGPSNLVVASAGSSVTAPVVTTPISYLLAGGTDGVATITSAVLVGTNTVSAPTGIYAFTGTGISDLVVMDLSDVTQEPTLVTFALGNGIYVHLAGAPGETPTVAATNLTTAGTDSPFAKRLLGDWVYWQDNYNGVQRLLSPALFSAAILTSTPINGSGLNKQITNVLATQRSRTGVPYGTTELGILVQAGIDVICNPIPQGSMFGLRTGKNTSSDGTRNGDNYPRLTSWLARSLAGPSAFGIYIGQDINPTFFENAFNTANTFCLGLIQNGLIQAAQVTCSQANNPQSQTQLGIVVASVLIQFFGIAMVFLVNLQSGQTVVIPTNTTYSFAAAA